MNLYIWELLQRALAFVLMVPAFCLIALAGMLIHLSSPGPLLFRQTRGGKGEDEFQMFKLRTMFTDAEDRLDQYLGEHPESLTEWNRYGRLCNDPRIVGEVARLVRRYSVDELPQLLNVVMGRMNLVGPRPLPREILTNMDPGDQHRRKEVRPGMTGLWQVSGRSDLDIRGMGRLDSSYVNGRSISLDLRIIARTFLAVLGRRGAY